MMVEQLLVEVLRPLGKATHSEFDHTLFERYSCIRVSSRAALTVQPPS